MIALAALLLVTTSEPPASAPVLTKPPELVTFVHATYPPALLAAGIKGEVLLLLELDETGVVTKIERLSATHEDFVTPAIDAARAFVFSPAEVDGAPSPIRLEYRYVFAPPPPPAPEPEAVVLPLNFSGVVKEAGTRRVLQGAAIYVDDEPRGETDEQGAFAVRGIASGSRRVRIVAALYESYETSEDFRDGEALRATYYLVPRQKSPYETVVRTKVERREVARVQLAQSEVRKVPGTFGDPVRVIENLPGMGRSFGGLGGQLIVHGASPQDTATYFDGVDIPFLYHATGLVSVVNAEFLERVDFYPAAFSARYGRATAGVVDVASKDLACDMLRGSAKIDAVDAAAFTCAPVGEWRLAAAGRRSYLDAVLPFVLGAGNKNDGSITVSPVYWDYQAKAARRLGKHTLETFAFGAYDTLRIVEDGGQENLDQSISAGITWHRLLLRHRYKDERLTLTSSIAPGYFDTDGKYKDEAREDLGEDTSYISLNAREDLSLVLSDMLTLNAGLDVHVRRARYSFPLSEHTTLKPYPAPQLGDDLSVGAQMARGDAGDYGHAYWVELVGKTHGLTFVPGLRIDRFDIFASQHVAIQPRLSTRYELLAGTTAKAAYGHFDKMSDVLFLVPGIGNPSLLPERARHLLVGVEQTLPLGLSIDVSGFYVWRRNLPSPTRDVVQRDGTVTPKIWESTGRGRSYGLELLLRRAPTSDGIFHGWIAYTLSRSYIKDNQLDPTYQMSSGGDEQGGLGDLNDAGKRREYLSPYDQTHIFTAVGQWTLPHGFEAGFRFQLSTGTPTTNLSGNGFTYYDADTGTYRKDPRTLATNNDRLPTFHRLDVRVDKTFTFDLWKLGVYAEVMNVYNHKEVALMVDDYRYEERAPVSFLPIVPTLGFKGEF